MGESEKGISRRSINDATKVGLPQPFQKYVYDKSGHRVITYSYAATNFGEGIPRAADKTTNNQEDETAPNFGYGQGNQSVDPSGLDGPIMRSYYQKASTNWKGDHYYDTPYSQPYADSSGALFCCRTHFSIVVTPSGDVVMPAPAANEPVTVTFTKATLARDGSVTLEPGTNLDKNSTHWVRTSDALMMKIKFDGSKWVSTDSVTVV